MEKWANGGLSGDDNIIGIAMAQMANDIVNMSDDAILNFYREHKE